jgi:hypothetical protein
VFDRLFIDGFEKSPISALRFSPRHCGVRQVGIISPDSQALISGFLQHCRKGKFLRVHHLFAVV